MAYVGDSDQRPFAQKHAPLYGRNTRGAFQAPVPFASVCGLVPPTPFGDGKRSTHRKRANSIHTVPANLRKFNTVPETLVAAMDALDVRLRNVQHLARHFSDAAGIGSEDIVSVDATTLSHTMDFFADRMQDARCAIAALIQSPRLQVSQT